MTLEDIQQAIAKLSADERERLRVWLARFDAAPSSQGGGEAENTAHKLGRLAGRTLGELRKRLRED